ncbi:MAG: penicillin-binding protein 2 [Epsilonproteobacteria bacterium]|nr:penicillin-binding protein 2 [Campylobacterota bacterium]NPA57333.1 penicillin-binding protein 2 [Campylobacterota bacterium]
MRFKFIIFIFISVWLLLLSKVYYLTIKSNEYYEALAKQNMIKRERILPTRGEIYDRNGVPLAVNYVGFKIKVTPHLSGNREYLRSVMERIVSYFPDQNVTKLLKRYRRQDSYYNHDYIEVIPYIDYDEMLDRYTGLAMERDIKIEPTFKRYYPYRDLASHVIGYVSRTNRKEAARDRVAKAVGIIGKSGLERYYNSYLQGELGYKKIKVTAYNEEIEVLEQKNPIQNRNLTLTLDIRLQKYIHKLFEGKAGAAIVMGVDGEILAAGSFPEYDLNIFVNGITKKQWQEIITDLNRPFTNKLVNGLYPPGSTIKMGVALSFLDSGLVTPSTSFYCGGYIQIGKRKFRCWSKYGHGEVKLRKAIRESCDVYFYEGSLRVGIGRIAQMLKTMGFGKKSGIDLPNEFIGVVPDKEWKAKHYRMPWYIGETVVCAIGQGYDLVTPIQLANYTALLATGRLPTPHFAKNIGEFPSKDVLSQKQKEMLPLIREAMYDVCNAPKGTATYHIRTPVTIAGKTGTAQVIGIPQEEKERMKEEEMEYFNRSHAWLTTYGPYLHPKYIVTVLVEHGGHGGSAAGPIVSKIYDKLIELGYIKVDGSKRRSSR